MEELNDTQSEIDDRGIEINWVGVSSFKFPVSVQDKESIQPTISEFSLAVDLSKDQRGTHMSRFIEVLNEHGNCISVKNISILNRHLLEKLEARKSRVNSSFSYFIEKKAPETGLKGPMDYLVNIESILDGEYFESEVTVNVPVTTLCPCSKAISERGAHNQRGNVKFSVKSSDPIWIEDLILLVESSASSELYSVLKRPDEKVVTERAYDNPVFVEDLVRNVALKANGISNINWYKVEAENFESIHNHNAYAVIVKELK